MLVDAGNSSVKWARVDGGLWRAQGRCEYDALGELEAQLVPETTCYIASVTSADRERRLVSVVESTGAAVVRLESTQQVDDLTNGYRTPSELGVDRWMGMIAARARTREPVVVVSVGTATTIDAVSADGDFLGGLILPGLQLMRQALATGTARVEPLDGAWQAFPTCTADAVASGAIAAVCGAVTRQYACLESQSGRPPVCFVTGGDGERVLPHLEVPSEFVSTLVLEGIDRISRERATK